MKESERQRQQQREREKVERTEQGNFQSKWKRVIKILKRKNGYGLRKKMKKKVEVLYLLFVWTNRC